MRASCVNSLPTKRTGQSAPASAQDQPDPTKPIWVECKGDDGSDSEEIKLDIPKEKNFLESSFATGENGYSLNAVDYEGDIVLGPDEIYLEYQWFYHDEKRRGYHILAT